MKLITRAAALCLSALLLLPSGALAAGEEVPVPPLTAEQKQEDLDLLYTTLKERHPDLFANTPEEDFLSRKASLEARLDTVGDLEFTFGLQSLVALAGDSHTTVSLSNADDMRFYPLSLTWFDGAWVLSAVNDAHADHLGQTVTALNDLTMEEVLDRFAGFVSADNPVKLRRQARQLLYAENILTYLGITQPQGELALTLTDEEGRESQLSLSPLSYDEFQTAEIAKLSSATPVQPATAYDKGKYYFSLPLNEETYYIQYNRCQQDPELAMDDFTAQVQADLEGGSYTQVLLDLRNNGGGSDGVIMPLLMLLAPQVEAGSLRLYGLVGETTFSSAVINAVMIQEMGGILAGGPTSGSVDHFGSVGSFELPNSGLRVGCSSKWISLSGLLEAAQGYGVESLRPDVALEQSLSDYLAGKDTLIEYLLSHGGDYKAPDRGGAPLSRGYFLDLLYAAAGGQADEGAVLELPFSDVLPFAYYAPAVAWGVEMGIVQGNDQGAFEAARPLTRAEAAVLLCRYAKALELPLTGTGEPAAFSDGADIPFWALDAAGQAGVLGLMDTKSTAFRPGDTMTRLDGQTLVKALAAH